jgi:hypothetical protein
LFLYYLTSVSEQIGAAFKSEVAPSAFNQRL